jgi:hypothetical protein
MFTGCIIKENDKRGIIMFVNYIYVYEFGHVD